MAPVLPKATSLTYFAEGGANVLYRIGIPTSSTMDEIPPTEIDHYSPATPQPTALEAWQVDLDQPDHSYLKGNLLRLRKDLPTVTTILEGQRDFHDHIEPLFEEDEIVMQTLIEVPQATVDQLNAVLVAMDNGGYRPKVFSGVYLAKSECGQLVKDMSSPPGRGWVTVELKPKWLSQSPNAPAGARRCRTCALGLARAAEGAWSSDSPTFDCTLCPLDLVSGIESKVERAVRAILNKSQVHGVSDSSLEKRLVAYFLTSPLLTKIRYLQQKLDPVGIIGAIAEDKGFRTAMTLRDCSLYLKVNRCIFH